MKLLILGAAVAASLNLVACASPGAVIDARPKARAASAVELDALKEVNRHIEQCHRQYAWPFAMMIDCPGQPTTVAPLTAKDISDMIDKAVAKALAPPT